MTLQELIEEGETLVARYVITGTQQKTFMGVAANGQQIELLGMSVLHFRNGRCFERWACSDSLVLANQIEQLLLRRPEQWRQDLGGRRRLGSHITMYSVAELIAFSNYCQSGQSFV